MNVYIGEKNSMSWSKIDGHMPVQFQREGEKREREREHHSLLSAIHLKFIVFEFDKLRLLTCLLLHCFLFT